MANWTDAERAALAATAQMSGLAGFNHFRALVPESDKGFDAWEVKRRRIGAKLTPIDITTEEATPNYVGFRMGFFDIETTFSTQPIVLYAAIADQFGNVQQFRKGPDITDDKALVDAYCRALEEYDILVSWNGKLFDTPVLGGRLTYHRLKPMIKGKHIDLMYYATGGFMRIGRRSLQSVSEYFETNNNKTPLSVRIWDKAMAGDEEAYEKIVEHCDADVLVLRDVFARLKDQIVNIHR